MPKFKSYPHTHTRSALKILIEKLFNKNVLKMERKDLGEANSVYFFKLSDMTEYVIRVCPKKRVWNGFDQEAWAYEKAREANVPTPKIVTVDTSMKLFPEAYFISERIRGKSGAKVILWERNRSKIFEQFGYYLSLIHTVDVDGFGSLEKKGKNFVGGNLTLWDFIEGELESGWFLEPINENKVLTKTEYSFYKKLIFERKRLFNVSKAKLVHGDYNLKNTVVFNNNIVAITDFENCKAMDPIYDFALINLWNKKGDDKIELMKLGYTNKSLFDDLFQEKINIYGVYLSLGLLGYYSQRRNKKGLTHIRKKLKELVSNLNY